MNEKETQSKEQPEIPKLVYIGKVALTMTQKDITGFYMIPDKDGKQDSPEFVSKAETVSEVLYQIADHLDQVLINETRETIKQTVMNPLQMKRAYILAKQIGDLTSYNWFRESYIGKKTVEDNQAIKIKIETLIMFGLLDVQADKNGNKYKVIMDKEARNTMLNGKRKKLEDQLKDVDVQLNALAYVKD